MMMNLCSDLVRLLDGRTLSTAESCTGGMLGSAITAISGSSKVYKGGIISYTNAVKSKLLNVSPELLKSKGAVSAEVAEAMALGVRQLLNTDYAVSVTGLAGPGGDEYGNPVGTVFIGYADKQVTISRHYLFGGGREAVRKQAAEEVLNLLLSKVTEK